MLSRSCELLWLFRCGKLLVGPPDPLVTAGAASSAGMRTILRPSFIGWKKRPRQQRSGSRTIHPC